MKKAEKFEVLKGNNSYYFTGKIKIIPDGRVQISTIKGEKLKFWENQIIGSKEVMVSDTEYDMIRDDKIEEG